MTKRGTLKGTALRWLERLGGVFGWGVLLVSCEPSYGSLRVEKLAGQGVVDGRRVEVPHGRIVALRLEPTSRGVLQYHEFDIVDLRVLDASIAYAKGSREVDEFLVGGRSVGTTSVRVSVNGQEVDTLEVAVIAATEEAP